MASSMIKESNLQTKCIQHLKKLHIYHINIYGAGRCSKGAPDVVACINGRFVAFEFKVGSNQMQSDQVVNKQRIEQNGGIHYTPRSLDEFIEIIEEIRS